MLGLSWTAIIPLFQKRLIYDYNVMKFKYLKPQTSNLHRAALFDSLTRTMTNVFSKNFLILFFEIIECTSQFYYDEFLPQLLYIICFKIVTTQLII